MLDVGIATVTLNGVNLGTVWTKPFRVEITDAVKSGDNALAVKVVNGWHNRVMGDQLHPDRKTYTKTNVVLGGRKGERLSPSGLIGPVQIFAENGK